MSARSALFMKKTLMRKNGAEHANITIGNDFPVIDALEKQ